jgi:transposase
MGYKKGAERDQQILFPETLDDYIKAESPVRFVDAFVERLDLAALEFERAVPAGTGRPGFDPRDLLKLYIYGYTNRMRSSRVLEREATRNVEVMWLLRKLTPDYKTIADFRRDHPKALRGVFREFVALCRELELLGGSRVAVDGSKFRAVNARKENHTQTGVKKAVEEERKRVEEYLAEMEEADRTEAEREELGQKREAALARKENYEAVLLQLEQSGQTQISRTDPESRLMKMSGGAMGVCYNVQTAVDEKHHLIVTYEVTNEVSDVNQLSAMAIGAKQELGVETLEVLADKGYYDGPEIATCVAAKITPQVPRTRTSKNGKKGLYTNERFHYDAGRDVYLCPAGQALAPNGWSEQRNGREIRMYANAGACASCPLRARCTESKKQMRVIRRPAEAPLLEEMEARLKADPTLYVARQQLAEHPFGTIKRGMEQGYFLLRGLSKTRGEFALTALAYDLKRAIAVLGVKRLLEGLTRWTPRPLPV